MEKLSRVFAEKIALELNLDINKKEVITYGMFVLLQMILSIALVIIFGSVFNVLIEALIISFTTSILRKYSGGVHANSSGACIVIGTIICIGQAFIIKVLTGYDINLNLNIIVGSLIFIWSYYTVYKLAPVDSPAKPIKKESKRKRMRKGSIIILTAYLIIVIISLVMYSYTGDRNFIKYYSCIYIGVLWQVFTLTTYGHFIMKKIDALFTHKLSQ